ncbi:hypothetical protein GGF32_009250 [Allomyces javanicus]|nr:hypothetical protein GGF32_009250 [Allomyces javanicus]
MTAPTLLNRKRVLMIPGPVEVSTAVLEQMAGPPTSHVDPNFINEFGDALEMLRTVFQCKDGQPFIVAGSGTLGWDMVAANLVEPGEAALVINTGLFGDRFGEALDTYGASVTHVRAPAIGSVPTLDQVAAALRERTYKVMTITHVDTSTGVLIDVPALARVVRTVSPNTLVIVDGVCSVGGEELDMDAAGVDVSLTASQKALGAPPGLSVVMASQRAMATFKHRVTKPTSYYASWAKWTPIMQAYEARKPSYFATPAVPLVKALHASLKQIVARPMADRTAYHAAVSDLVKRTVTAWGLRLVPQGLDLAAHTMTAVYYPPGVSGAKLLASLAAKGVTIAGGLHPQIATQYFRIGHMGITATHDEELRYVHRTLALLEAALREQGYLQDATDLTADSAVGAARVPASAPVPAPSMALRMRPKL